MEKIFKELIFIILMSLCSIQSMYAIDNQYLRISLGEYEYQEEIQMQSILDKLGLRLNDVIASPVLLYTKEREKGENLLTEQEHNLLLVFLWKKNSNLEPIVTLAEKLIPLRHKIGVQDMGHIAAGHIDTAIIFHIKMRLELDYEEERFLWIAFHGTSPNKSNRDYYLCDSISIIDSMRQGINRKAILLDVGCGPEARALIKLKYKYDPENDKIDAYGIDMKITSDIDGKVFLTEGDIKKMPYKDNFFDVVFENMVFMYFGKEKEFIAAIREIIRVLKPNGRFVLGDDCHRDRIQGMAKGLGVSVGDFNNYLIITKLAKAGGKVKDRIFEIRQTKKNI